MKKRKVTHGLLEMWPEGLQIIMIGYLHLFAKCQLEQLAQGDTWM